jgi:hypothetical protein
VGRNDQRPPSSIRFHTDDPTSTQQPVGRRSESREDGRSGNIIPCSLR